MLKKDIWRFLHGGGVEMLLFIVPQHPKVLPTPQQPLGLGTHPVWSITHPEPCWELPSTSIRASGASRARNKVLLLKFPCPVPACARSHSPPPPALITFLPFTYLKNTISSLAPVISYGTVPSVHSFLPFPSLSSSLCFFSLSLPFKLNFLSAA